MDFLTLIHFWFKWKKRITLVCLESYIALATLVLSSGSDCSADKNKNKMTKKSFKIVTKDTDNFILADWGDDYVEYAEYVQYMFQGASVV